MHGFLLTGVTGYFGGHVAHSLLKHSPADLYCLIRHSPYVKANKRIERSLRRSGLWCDSFEDRIIPIEGNLSLPQLGVPDQEWADVRKHAQAIFHVGADVSFLKPYSVLRDSNVIPLATLSRLAQDKGIPIHFSSSTSLGRCVQHFDEGVPETILQPRENLIADPGYAESKLCAELVGAQSGADFSIYRLPRLTVAANTPCGLSGHNIDDLMSQFIKSVVQLGKIPKIEILDYWLPVDIAADLLVKLALEQHERSVFHLTPDTPLTWDDLLNQVESEFTQDDWEPWSREVMSEINSSDLKEVFELVIDALRGEICGQRFQNQETQGALASVGMLLPAASVSALNAALEVWRSHDPAFARFVKMTAC